jgi:DNA-directed RNA polymerase specialized sigma24 family protein
MPSLYPADRQRMRDAIAALPEPTGRIYLAHLLNDDDYPTIGAREGLSVRAVERHIADAIVFIDRFLRNSHGDAE